MSFEIETISVESPDGMTIHNRYYVQTGNGSRRLLVMLPGRGYVNELPLMYYTTKIGLQQGYDALWVTYGYQYQRKPSGDLLTIQQESRAAVMKALERGYDRVVLVGKSLGTLVAGRLAVDPDIPVQATILLTPIRNIATQINQIPALAIIGTSDPSYSPDHTQDTTTLTWRVYEGLNHALEASDNWQQSLVELQRVMRDIEKFLVALR